ncbi:AMP-binding protein [Amycolatopsis rubida]|uniref:Nonribosomal peptide synthetase protein BlmIII n=1 Tax=Amycolatopsis rubida TaxID=112413 RepID=A0A1I6AIX5_9PSEU|nr:AMP-binding protein [Amycolatopsis rubida]SFQ68605.1 nonribosomal peptide synthetase protein BlmIII [Amycolatopsis rubida]
MSMAEQRLSLLPADQRELLRSMNELTGDVPDGALPDAVAALADAHGDALAAREPARGLTRAELLSAADRVAAALRNRAVRAGDRVVLCAEPGAGQVIGLLGILRAGAAALPVDPGAAQTVRWRRAEREGASVVVSQSWLFDRLRWPEHLGAVAIDGLPEASFVPGPGGPDGHAAACVLGDGAVLRHRDLLNLAADLAGRFGIGEADRMIALTPIASGRGVLETSLGLLTGAALVFGEDIDLRNPAAWLEVLARERVSVWHSTPTLLDLLVTEAERREERLPEPVRLVLLSGERLPGSLVRRLRALSGPDLVVANLSAAGEHGPWAACHESAAAEPETPTVPIGRPMRNQRIHVLGENGGVCPAWVTGQVHYGGLAAEAVTAPPTHPETGEPLLRTAQFGRVLPEGVVEIVGDESAQLTVHGRRLHVHDAEVALAGLPGVHAAAVVTTAGESASIGFARLRPGADVAGPELLDQLRRKVSPYLLPGRIAILDAFPLTPDGRVDRTALAALDRPAPPPPAAASPAAGAGEDLLAAATAIACRVLGVADIEPDMNLVDLGATSVELVRLATVVEDELGIGVAVEELLRFPSVAVLIGPHLATVADPRPSGPPAGDLLLGLAERQAFKDAHAGIRAEYAGTAGIVLGGSADPRARERRSHRRFSAEPVALADLAVLLGALRTTEDAGETKYWYPSAGSAYPLGAYLDVAPGRVADLGAGVYYLDPARAELVPVGPGAGVPAAAHAEVNRAALAESAFVLYLISRMDAITPLYGELAWDFSVFEAGAMAQLLMSVAGEAGLGLCPVGTLDPAELTAPLRLRPDDRFVHALLGGVPAPAAGGAGGRQVPDLTGRLRPGTGERP